MTEDLSNFSMGRAVSRRRFLGGAVAAAVGVALAACAPAPSPAPPETPKAAPPTPEAKAPPKPKQTVKLKLAQSAPGLSFAPVYLAREAGYFADEGIDLDWQALQGGALVTTALISGEIQLGGVASKDSLQAFEKKLDLITIAGINTSLTVNLGASKTFMQKKGLTQQSPVEDRIKALRGAKIGIGSVASPLGDVIKYLLKVNGMDPEKDVEFVVAGQAAARLAALQENKIDVLVSSPPEPEQAEDGGFGVVYIVLGRELPVFKDFLWQVLSVKKDWAEKNPELAQRAARAIGRANNHILNDLEDSKKILKKALSDINPALVDSALNNIKSAFGPDARMTELMWKNPIDVFTISGAIKTPVPPTEGTVWTNKYLVDVPKR